MSNRAKVDLRAAFGDGLDGYPADLRKELMSVAAILNLTQSVRNSKTKQYEASPTNIAVQNNAAYFAQKVNGMVSAGLSYEAGDYYVYVQFGGKPSITKTPNGIIKAMNKLASLQGYLANINVGCVFKGHKELLITRNGLIDELHLVNNPDSEITGIDNDIVAPYAVVTLIDKVSKKTISRKVTIVRSNEYQNAKNQGSYTHKSYPVPMATKIALKRAGEDMLATLGIDDSVQADELRNEIREHNEDYSDPESNEIIKQEEPKFTDVKSEVLDINSL